MNIYLEKLQAGNSLTVNESHTLFSDLLDYPVNMQTQLLELMNKKKESTPEILGARDALFNSSQPIEYSDDVLDIVGSGGDGIGSFNISTAASMVIASCGVKVAKHGGRKVTSCSGSTDVLQELGISMADVSEQCIQSLDTIGYSFLSAQVFNPGLKSFGSLRKKIGVPTIFNVLGPLLNPIRPRRQVVGVYRRDLVPKVAEVLKELGLIHALVVHSEDGLDEFSVSAKSHVAILRFGKITAFSISPEDLGIKRSSIKDIKGGDAFENAEIIKGIFSGLITGPKLDIVVLNSAAGLLVADKVQSLEEGVVMAYTAISRGDTLEFFNKLREVV
ncbi:MAG: anthranilate phosphoribosyltransferase [Legionellaceae bacterium]|nr:anthranilate phosphoribosyltransferase [Legionellaceae bacterium]